MNSKLLVPLFLSMILVISCSKTDSIRGEQSQLRLTLEVSDDNPDERMAFQFSPGFSKLDSISGNYYVFETDYSDYIIKNPSKELRIVAINSQNQVSEFKRIEIIE